MTKHFSSKLLLVALSLSVSGCAVFQPKVKAPAATTEASASKDKNGIKPYNQVITKNAKSSKGLFTVHQIDEKCLVMKTCFS